MADDLQALLDRIDRDGIKKCTEFYHSILPNAQIIEIAAIDEKRSLPLLNALKKRLSSGPFSYDEDEITDVYERDIAAEFIRETLLEQLKQEVPHCVAVVIDKWIEKGSRVSISATLHIEREGHRGIIIGKGGERIKAIRESATKRIEEFLQTRVTLSLFVKVTPDWRNNKKFLTDVGLE